MRWIMIFAALPLLAACSEQQMCVSRATKDLRVVRGFIAETEANLARGYALVTVQEIEFSREPCGKREDGSTRYCREPHAVDVQKPRAIDLDAEAAKLASLQTKESSLSAQAQSAIAMCEQAYPEG